MNQKNDKLTYGQLISILYGENLQQIIDIINKSVYAEDYQEPENIAHLHTGFSFETHKGKKVELIVNMKTGELIRQVRTKSGFNIPQINGLFVIKHGYKFFNAFHHLWLFQTNLSYDEDWKIIEFESIDNEDFDDVAIKKGNKEFTEVKIASENGSIKNFPLRKVLSKKLFFNGIVFIEDIPDSEYYASRDDYHEDDDDWYDNNSERYGQYEGTWAQDVEGLSDDFINDVLDGDPDAYWNID